MQNTDTLAVTVPRQRITDKVRARAAGVLAFLATVLYVTPAHATTGLLGGAETSFFSSISTFLTANLLPLVFVLAAVVIGAGMLIKYGRKAVSS